MDHLVLQGFKLFWSQQINPQRFMAYVARILSSTKNTQSLVYLSLFYTYKISKAMQVPKASRSEYRIFVTSLMLADCILNDNCYAVKSWSLLTGFGSRELVEMRREFLATLGYSLQLNEQAFAIWVQRLHSLIPLSTPVYSPISMPLGMDMPTAMGVQVPVFGMSDIGHLYHPHSHSQPQFIPNSGKLMFTQYSYPKNS